MQLNSCDSVSITVYRAALNNYSDMHIVTEIQLAFGRLVI